MFGKSRKGQAAIERTSSSARHLKGQAAMEYLMTYGWAILVIVIVLAILAFYLPTLIKTPESCLFTYGFSCDISKPVIVSEATTNNVYTIFRLDNQQGQTVVIKRVLCTTETAANVNKTLAYDLTGGTPITIAAGGNFEFAPTSLGGQKIYCRNGKGGYTVLPPNAAFTGTLAVWYNFQNDVTDAPERLATASLSGTTLVP